MLSLVYYAIFIPFAPIGSWSLDRFGLRKTLIFGCILNTLGSAVSWCDVFVPVADHQKYILQMLGQVLTSIGQPFIFNPVSKVTSSWFGAMERTTANCVMSLGQPLGAALVLEVAPLLVKDPNNMPHLNLFLFIMTAVVSIPVIFVHDLPPTPPARSAEVQTIPWLEGTKKLAKNVQFLILMIIFSFYYGTFNVYSTLLSDYVYPEGYSEADAGRLGMVSIIVGVLGTLIIGQIADRKQAHELLLKILVILNTIAALLFYLGCTPNSYWLLMISSILSGVSGAPIISLVGIWFS